MAVRDDKLREIKEMERELFRKKGVLAFESRGPVAAMVEDRHVFYNLEEPEKRQRGLHALVNDVSAASAGGSAADQIRSEREG